MPAIGTHARASATMAYTGSEDATSFNKWRGGGYEVTLDSDGTAYVWAADAPEADMEDPEVFEADAWRTASERVTGATLKHEIANVRIMRAVIREARLLSAF